MRVLPIIVLLTLMSASTGLADQTQDDNWKRCRSDDPQQALGGCSALIQSGREAGVSLAEAFYDRGLANRREGDFDDAIKDFDHALQLNPNSTDAFYQRGSIYGHQRNYDRAIRDYDQAIHLDPNLAKVFYGRAWAYM
jgi:tetratricopeptide (TPR) repeat protein